MRERALPPVRAAKGVGAVRLDFGPRGPVLRVPAEAPADCAAAFMRGWRRGEALGLRERDDARLLRSAALWAEALCPRLDVPAPEIALTGGGRVWGACDAARGRVRLHRDLSMMPDGAAREVLLHELCHLREPAHGRAFWQLMDAIMPDWAEWEGMLRCLARKRGR